MADLAAFGAKEVKSAAEEREKEYCSTISLQTSNVNRFGKHSHSNKLY